MVGFPAIGDRIGPYRVDAEIGRGGMGIVYRATQLALDRPVALKILDPRFATDAAYTARFSREASILASLDSPHVIQIFDHGVSGEHLYLAMQYVAGGDLGQYIARTGPLTPTAALQVYRHVLEALRDAHARGVVHRDVKPSNVLLRADVAEPFAYLCDFGIAQTAETGLTQPGLVPGSWAFMSPERHAGHPATPQSDLYSAACVLWVMLTGRNVYSGTDVQIAMSHLNAPVPQLPGSDPLVVALNRLFWTNLAKNPAERPDSAAEALVLAQGALGPAAGVAPLSISKPDSGIFRPIVPAGIVAVADGSTATPPGEPDPSDATRLAVRHRAAADAPPEPAAAPATAPSPAARPTRAGLLRWLAGGAAVVLVVLVVAALMNGTRLLDRPTPGAASPAATPSASTTPSTVASFECWDGATVAELSRCSAPTGREGLAYVYPSLVPGDCTFVDYRASTGAYECTTDLGLIRYRFWKDPAESEDHYTTKYDHAVHTAMLLDGHQVGDLYRLNKRSGGVYKMSGLWLDRNFSFSVEADTIDKREKLFDQVRFRAYDQLTGYPAGTEPEEARLG